MFYNSRIMCMKYQNVWEDSLISGNSLKSQTIQDAMLQLLPLVTQVFQYEGHKFGELHWLKVCDEKCLQK